MSQIIRLTQGSPEWLSHRLTHRNASETAAVLGLSPWTTPYQLWLQRTGRATQVVNAAMQRGTELEATARDAYEALTGDVMQPLVLVEGEYSASLDGMTLDGSLILEIKCPFKGRESSLWKDVTNGLPPVPYFWQIQHQLMVSGAALAHLYVFDGRAGILLEQKPEPESWPLITHGWDVFMACLREDKAPALADGDKRLRNDDAWRIAAESYLFLKQAAEAAERSADSAKAKLISLAEHTSETGAGVTVTRFWKQGTIDYKKVPALAGVDLERYRGKPREEIRVSAQR